MMRARLAPVIGGCLAAGLTVTGVVAAVNRPSYDDGALAAATHAAAPTAEDDHSHTRKDPGPPPWAHADNHHRHGAKEHGDKSWKSTWHMLTPAQREKRMTELAKAHAQGMREWAECVSSGRDQGTKRDACEKPLPPGLAKRLI